MGKKAMMRGAVEVGKDSFVMVEDAKANPKKREQALKLLKKDVREKEHELSILRNTIDYLGAP